MEPTKFISNAVASVISVVSFGYQPHPEDEKFQDMIADSDYFEKFAISFFHEVSCLLLNRTEELTALISCRHIHQYIVP